MARRPTDTPMPHLSHNLLFAENSSLHMKVTKADESGPKVYLKSVKSLGQNTDTKGLLGRKHRAGCPEFAVFLNLKIRLDGLRSTGQRQQNRKTDMESPKNLQNVWMPQQEHLGMKM